MNGLDATNQPRIHPEYEVETTKLRLKKLVPLAKNLLSKMGTWDWKALQVTINTSRIPPKDDISLEERTSSIVNYKYMKSSFSCQKLRKKFTEASINIQFFNAKVNSLESE